MSQGGAAVALWAAAAPDFQRGAPGRCVYLFSLCSRRDRSSIIFLRCLSFIFFQLLHSSRVRKQPMHKPVLLSNLQMSIQGDSVLIMDDGQ